LDASALPVDAAAEALGRRMGDVIQPSKLRSRVTNGRTLFVDRKISTQSPWARRLRDIIALHVSDQGGPETHSARRVAA
jgi:hypothetical protein